MTEPRPGLFTGVPCNEPELPCLSLYLLFPEKLVIAFLLFLIDYLVFNVLTSNFLRVVCSVCVNTRMSITS